MHTYFAAPRPFRLRWVAMLGARPRPVPLSKRRDRPYRSGRSPDWVKVKNPERAGRDQGDRRLILAMLT
jgi:hypothetical protein